MITSAKQETFKLHAMIFLKFFFVASVLDFL